MREFVTGLKVSACLILLAALCVVVYQAGKFSGIRLALRETAPAAARMTYDFAMRKEYPRLSPDGLCTPEVASKLMDLEEQYGPVGSYKIIRVDTSPLSIPISVVLHVERSSGRFQEILISATMTQFDQIVQQQIGGH